MPNVDASWFTGIIDMNHKNTEPDWVRIKAAGVAAVIHKASEGVDFEDKAYTDRRERAKAAGLLWGAYHYSGDEDDDGAAQADFFIKTAAPQPDEFVCFDCEKHGTLANMEAFSARIRERLGRRPAIYGRRLLGELMQGHGDSSITAGVLWFDNYPDGPAPTWPLPEGWADWTLWQYTDGASGPGPTGFAGIDHNYDRSAFKGTEAEFRAAWPFTRT